MGHWDPPEPDPTCHVCLGNTDLDGEDLMACICPDACPGTAPPNDENDCGVGPGEDCKGIEGPEPLAAHPSRFSPADAARIDARAREIHRRATEEVDATAAQAQALEDAADAAAARELAQAEADAAAEAVEADGGHAADLAYDANRERALTARHRQVGP